jgi:putative transcriptional regulator
VKTGTISNRIRVLRFERGEMSQTELGQRIGVTRQTLAAIEAGKYSPSLEIAFRIAEVFNVSLGDVFQWSSTAANNSNGEGRTADQRKG